MNDSQRNSTEIAPATQSSPAGVLRRFGAIIYDTLICVAVLMIATVPFIPFLNGKVLDPSEVGSLAYVYRIAVEERAPVATLGPAYAMYMTRTKRLVPFVF